MLFLVEIEMKFCRNFANMLKNVQIHQKLQKFCNLRLSKYLILQSQKKGGEFSEWRSYRKRRRIFVEYIVD